MDNSYNEINLYQLIEQNIKSTKNFLRKHFLILLTLIIVGAIVGYFTSPSLKQYQSSAIVIPNFNSVDYIYNDVELLNSKIKERDVNFLKKNNISPNIIQIEIEPIINIYQYIDNDNDYDNKRFDLLKLFAEDGDINKVTIDEKTSKNYKTHQINILTKNNKLSDHDINTILSFLNNNEFYKKIQQKSLENIKSRMVYNSETINQINTILAKSETNNNTSNLLYFNNNSQLNDLINNKNYLIKENEKLSVVLIESTDIVKKVAQTLNVKETKFPYFYLAIFPLLFIVIYFIYLFLRKK